MKTIFLILLFAVAVYPQTPLLTLMDDGITYEAETTAFISRVEADGGEVLDPDGLNSFIALLKAQGVYDNLKLLADPNWGVKLNSSNIIKLYDLLGNDIVQANTSLAPTLIDYIDNNSGTTALSSTLFDGTDNYMLSDATTINQPTTIYLSLRPLRWASGNVYFSSYTWDDVFVQQNNVDGRLLIDGSASWQNTNTMTVTDDMAVLRFVLNGANSEMQYNIESEATGNMGTGNMGGICIGAGSFPFFYSNIETGTIAIFDADLDATPTSAIQSFLMTRWGL